MSHPSHYDPTIFSVPVRWAIRLLAWLAFFVASYLAWTAATQTAAAGCAVGSAAGCDEVLTSTWSKWLTVPVSIVGLACYATLAGLSVLIGLTSPHNSRWIDTLIIMLSILAAGASIWFIGLQLFAIGHLCRYCMLVDLSGIALGGLALWSAIQGRSATRTARAADPGLMALRSTMPAVARVAPLRVAHTTARPSLGIALGGATALLAVLIGGQVIWPTPTHLRETVALDQPIDMTNAKSDATTATADSSSTPETHVAMRIPTESEPGDGGDESSNAAESAGSDMNNDKADSESSTGDAADPTPTDSSNGPSNPPANEEPPKRKRLLKFLGGKLTLDTYEHPILGDPEAPHVFVEMVSYDCAHCRKMHRIVQRGMKRYGNQLAVLIMPVPLEMACNKLVTDPKASHPGACTTARMAVGVADIKPSAFRQFHDWLMADPEKPPSQAKIVGKAYGMVDSSRLRELSRSDALNNQFAKYIDLFGTLQKQKNDPKKTFGLPVQILGDEVLTGMVEDEDDVYRAWEKNLGIKRL